MEMLSNKPSSKSLLQLTSVGFAWEERPLWQHSVAEVIISHLPPHVCMLSSHGSMTRWVSTFLKSTFYDKNCAESDVFLNNAWVRLVMAKSEKSAREKRKCGAHERERDLRMRWKSPIVTAVVSVWVLATESSQHPVNWAQNDGHLCTSRIFCLPRSHVLLFSFSILTDVLILLNVVTMHTFCLASIIPSECRTVCVLYFLVTWPVSVNFNVDDIFSGRWGGETWVMV